MTGEGEGTRGESKKVAPRVRFVKDPTSNHWRFIPLEPEPVEEDRATPPPEVPGMDFDVQHPAVPKVIKKAHADAVASGWAVRLVYAKGPRRRVNPVRWEQVSTLTLRCSKRGRRVVLCWEWKINPKGTAWSWYADGAYDAPWHPCTHERAKEALHEG